MKNMDAADKGKALKVAGQLRKAVLDATDFDADSSDDAEQTPDGTTTIKMYEMVFPTCSLGKRPRLAPVGQWVFTVSVHAEWFPSDIE